MWRKKSEEYIVYDREKNRIGAFCPEEFPLAEAVIIQKSIQYFDDPNPCCLHSNAVKVRLLEEIRKSLAEQKKPIFIRALSRELQGYMELGEQAAFLEYR